MVNQERVCAHCGVILKGNARPQHVFRRKTLSYQGVMHTCCFHLFGLASVSGGDPDMVTPLQAAFRLSALALMYDADTPVDIRRLADGLVWSENPERWLAQQQVSVVWADAARAKVADLRRRFEATYTLEGGINDAGN